MSLERNAAFREAAKAYEIEGQRPDLNVAMGIPGMLGAGGLLTPGKVIGPNEFLAVATNKVGPVKARFKGKVRLTDLDPPNGYKITGEGQGGPVREFEVTQHTLEPWQLYFKRMLSAFPRGNVSPTGELDGWTHLGQLFCKRFVDLNRSEWRRISVALIN